MNKIIVPSDYDYVGVYLTDKCHLSCPYCITSHYGSNFLKQGAVSLQATQWIEGLNRLVLPKDLPISLQGGEPFLHRGIWEILENVNHKIDIMTALPPHLKRDNFLKLKTLDWNKRDAPYPTIRVSYHKGQNDYKELIERIAELQDILSIGLYYLTHPDQSQEEIEQIKSYARKFNVELRLKDFLGMHNGKRYGEFYYPDAVLGERKGINVFCKNTVVPVSPAGDIYLCHSDLYFKRSDRVLGNLLDDTFEFPSDHLPCDNYGLCSECDVKIKTNHYQQYGYTSVNIKFEKDEIT